MKNFRTVLFAAAMVAAVFSASSCKKGANDPFVSFKSRDGRLTGTWKLVGLNHKFVQTTTNGVTVTTSETVTKYENGISTATTNPGNTSTNTKIDFQMTFDKDGSYKSITNNYNSSAVLTGTVEVDGTWFWGSDSKRKKNVLVSSLQADLIQQFGPGQLVPCEFEIDQLKSKELRLKRHIRIKSGLPNSNSETEIFLEYIFEPVK
jgi:hypothetical protein